MSDTWGRNPYEPYTNQAAQWERQQAEQRAEEDRRYRDNLAAIERNNAQQMASIRQQQSRQILPPAPAPSKVSTYSAPGTPQRVQTEKGGSGTLAAVGAIIGLVVAAGSGASILGGIIAGGIIGALLLPVVRLLTWLTVTALKIALFAIIVLVVLAALGALFG